MTAGSWKQTVLVVALGLLSVGLLSVGLVYEFRTHQAPVLDAAPPTFETNRAYIQWLIAQEEAHYRRIPKEVKAVGTCRPLERGGWRYFCDYFDGGWARRKQPPEDFDGPGVCALADAGGFTRGTYRFGVAVGEAALTRVEGAGPLYAGKLAEMGLPQVDADAVTQCLEAAPTAILRNTEGR